MQLRGNIRKSNKNNVTWMVAYSGIVKLWVFAGPEYEFTKEEIKKHSKRHKEEMSLLIEKVATHIRKLRQEIKYLKSEIKKIKEEDDNSSVVSNKTNFTDFSNLKVYDESD